MAKQLLIRDVPPRVKSWIDTKRKAEKLSQNQFVIKALEKVCA